jgi:hypothetical protein
MIIKKSKRTSFIGLGILLCGLILLALGLFTRPAFAQPSAQQTLTAPWYAFDMVPVSLSNPKQTSIFVFDIVSATVWQNTLTAGNSIWGGWKLIGSSSPKVQFTTISGVASAGNRMDLFMTDRNKNVWHKKSINNAAWYPPDFQWEDVGVMSDGTHTQAVSWGSGRIDLFNTKTDSLATTIQPIVHKWSAADVWGPSQTGWETVSGVPMSTYATTWGANHLDIIGVDAAGVVMHKWWDGSAWLPSSGWETLTGASTRAARPFAISWGANRLDIFVRASASNYIFQKTWNGTTWSNWLNIGGAGYGDVVGTSWASGRIDLFENRTNGVYHKAFINGAWSPSPLGWENVGGNGFSTLSVTSWGVNRLDLFGAKSSDGTLWHLAWNGTRWVPDINAWENLSPHPVVTASPTTRIFLP